MAIRWDSQGLEADGSRRHDSSPMHSRTPDASSRYQGRKVRQTQVSTTVPDSIAACPGDLVKRHPNAGRPNHPWVADFTYCSTWQGRLYVVFIIDANDNALAEIINGLYGLYKTEVIHRRAPWKTKAAVVLAMLEWVFWFNHRRLLGSIGDIPPAEAEQRYYRQFVAPAVEPFLL